MKSLVINSAIIRAHEQIERRINSGNVRAVEAKNQMIFDRWQLRTPVGKVERALYKEYRVSKTSFGWYFFEGNEVPGMLEQFKERFVTREIYCKEVLRR